MGERLYEIDAGRWDTEFDRATQQSALAALEAGKVLVLPALGFALSPTEQQELLSPTVLASGKNVSFVPSTGTLRGTSLEGVQRQSLQEMMARCSQQVLDLMAGLLPTYASRLVAGRTSFRPAEIAGRPSSWRKDDSRLHVDSFPSSPVRGDRILRLFTNVHPAGGTRTWRLGEPFENVARRFVPAIRPPLPGSGRVLLWIGVTKSRRSLYDHYMLGLHDRMKADLQYQAHADQITHDFSAGSTWVAFTDQVSHAATAGQYLLEQTCYLPISAMADAEQSPLRILERLTGRRLL